MNNGDSHHSNYPCFLDENNVGDNNYIQLHDSASEHLNNKYKERLHEASKHIETLIKKIKENKARLESLELMEQEMEMMRARLNIYKDNVVMLNDEINTLNFLERAEFDFREDLEYRRKIEDMPRNGNRK